HRRVQLPAELTDIVDAKRSDVLDAGNLDLARRTPGKGGIAKVRSGACGEDIARAWAGQDEHPLFVRYICDFDLLAGSQAPAQLIDIIELRRSRGDNVEPLGRKPSYGDLALDETVLVEQVPEGNAAVARRYLVRANALEKTMGVGPGDLEFCEGRE